MSEARSLNNVYIYIYILKTGSEWFGFVFGPDGMSTRAPHALVPKVNAAFCDF